MRQRRTCDKTKERLEYVRAHQGEQSMEQMAAHLGVTRQGIMYLVRRLGVEQSPLRPYRTDVHVQAAICRRGGKVSDKQLGRELGVPPYVVRYYRGKYGIEPYCHGLPK